MDWKLELPDLKMAENDVNCGKYFIRLCEFLSYITSDMESNWRIFMTCLNITESNNVDNKFCIK